MAEIPQATGPSVRRAPLPTPLANPNMATPDAFGASIAQGLQRGADIAYRAKQEAEEDRDRVDAMNAANKFTEEENKRNLDYRNRQGVNAKDLTKEAEEAYRKSQNELEATLTTPGARQRFRMSTDSRWANHSSVALADHQRTQLDAYESQTLEGAAELARQDALNGVTSIETALAKQQMTRDYLAHKKGEAPEVTAIKTQADTDRTIGDFITQQQKLGDPAGAQKAFDLHKDKLSPDVRAVIEQDLTKASQSAKAMTYADAIMQDPAQTKAKAYQQLKMIEDPELRAKTAVNVEREFAQRTAIKNETQATSYESIADRIDAGESYDAIIKEDPALTGLLDDGQTRALRNLEQHVIQRTEPEEWAEPYAKARNTASQFPEDFAKKDLRLLKGQVRKSEYDDLNQRQQAIKALLNKSDDKTPEVTKGFLTVEDHVNNALRSIEVNPGSVDGVIDPRATRFRMLMDKKVRAAGGVGKVTAEQVQKFADDLILERDVLDPASTFGKAMSYTPVGWMFGAGKDGTKKVRSYELPSYDNAAFSYDQMSKEQRTPAVDALGKAGVRDPTPLEIQEWHLRTVYNNAQAP